MTKKQHIEVDGRELTISNLDKVFYPESGFTKGQVIKFYSDIAAAILPHLRDRPLTLKRYPDGITAEHFYEKNAPKHTPPWVKRFAVPRSEGGADIHYVLCNDRATLIWATNLGDIEKHVLLAHAPELNRPTSVVFDLDPGERAGILECGEIALHLKKVFDGLKLESFVKVSGSKGLHLAVPLNTAVTYEATQPFAKAIAELVMQQLPDRVVSEMAKTLRRGKVLIDWSQNSDFKTTVCVYAMRAKDGGPFISMPVTWAELAKAVKSKKAEALFFKPDAAVKRIKRLGDLFAPVLKLRQALPAAFSKALAAGPPPKLSSWPRNRSKSGQDHDKSLREYAAKRDHTKTPEPAAKPVAKTATGKGVHRFVIQKHEASHLHYDWRLEMQGVLRSWAVPKGPPTKPREARLAMHVEDHPLDYADFEGTIPPGNYGAGTVMVWDQGEYEDLTGNPGAAFHQGKMHVIMRGKKLKGEWILVKDRREEGTNKWLLIKAGKPITISAKADDTSAISGRSMKQIATDNDAQWQSNTPAKKHAKRGPSSHRIVKAAFIAPMQCKAVPALPEGDDWTYEIKFDGYRCIAVKTGKKVTLFSRNENRLNDRFPAVADALATLPGDFAVDGEIVALDEQGRPSFQLLQNSGSAVPALFFYAFDLLSRDGEELIALPIERRRELLGELLADPTDPMRLSPLLQAPAGHILEAVQRLGLEGVVGKRVGSKYEAGERSGAWIKRRINRAQEFVIGGFVPGSHGFDSLIVGVYEKKRLQFVAKVRNGFVPRIRDEIFSDLEKLIIDECPFVNLPEKKASRWGEALTAEKMKECRWVKPELVCQVEFVEWTDGGKLRHCTFIAMRDDKKPGAVVRET
ncbi:MAG: bifunctional non-ous end joining protein LigD [Chthoniobacter sp.]|jgi:bifunctional non-homologous end joining protein LigD|nr:bifunctional non-ous end joining protein LigD [Chthoniobacter sp.]